MWFEDAGVRLNSCWLQAQPRRVSYWTVNSFFPQNWLVLESMYNVNKVM